MGAWLQRMGRYRKMIDRVLKKHDLPRDLVYVAMIESGFNPTRTSRAGAAGLWQFMRRSGRGYGLHRDYWVDERRNPLLSTEAAARYLKDIYARFGSWELALASYNAGVGAVLQSVRKYNTNDYWQLCRYESGLPWSTTLYVPKILATAIVGRNRSYFGFGHIKPDPEERFTLVSVSTSVTLGQAASAAGVSKEVIEDLNPELRRGRTPPASKTWLRVPKGTAERFYTQLARIKGRRAKYKPYVVRLGDTPSLIAEEHGISRATLRRINGVQQDAELRPGLVILVPARKPKKRLAEAKGSARTKSVNNKESVDDLILVPLPRGKPRRIRGRERVFYRVVTGDSLSEIARHLQVAPRRLADWNSLDPAAKLVSGMILQAFVPKTLDRDRVVLLDPKQVRPMVAGSDTFLDLFEERKGRRRITYVARRGDNLRSVSRRFGLSVGSLMRINQFSRRTKLQQGQSLVVYVEKKRLRKRKKKRTRRGKRARKSRNKRRKKLTKTTPKKRRERLGREVASRDSSASERKKPRRRSRPAPAKPRRDSRRP
jgi:membrane-bound lytic murein transglycosylase D